MYQIRRTTTAPGSDLRITVDGPDGMLSGTTLYFPPAGQDGDTQIVEEAVARVLMGDPGLAVHFECDPALDGQASKEPAEAEPVKEEAATADPDTSNVPEQPAQQPARRRARKAKPEEPAQPSQDEDQ